MTEQLVDPTDVVVPIADLAMSEPASGGVAHIVLPAYNEEGSLPSLLGRLAVTAAAEKLIVWVVDDGSADQTAAIAGAGVPGVDVRLVSHPHNLGLGQAVYG